MMIFLKKMTNSIIIEFKGARHEVDLTKIMNREFRNAHPKMLKSAYFKNFLTLMYCLYSENRGKMIPAKPSDVFKPYLITDYDTVRCVIIGGRSYENSNGILCGTDKVDIDSGNPEITMLENHFTSTGNLWFSSSLTEWVEDGVLGLNISPFMKKGEDPAQYVSTYRQFLINIIFELYKKNPKIIFATTHPNQTYILKMARVPDENIVFGNSYLSVKGSINSTIFETINSKLEKLGEPTIMFAY